MPLRTDTTDAAHRADAAHSGETTELIGPCADSSASRDQWFAGDRGLYFLNGSLGQEAEDNPERLEAGHAVMVPRSVCVALGIGLHLGFTLTETRCLPFGSIGFCQIDDQPGRGVWIRLGQLSRSDWHTRLERARPTHRR